MNTRKTITTEGKEISFLVDDNYYTDGKDLSLVFNGSFSKSKYCVLCTAIYRDKDNCVLGAQAFHFYDNKEEALETYKLTKKLTPKPFNYTFAYADVMLVENVKI